MFVRIDRRRKLLATILLKALKLTNQEILEKFYETENYKVKKDGIFQLQVIPRRLMGKIAPVDITAKGELILKKGERISARHIRKIESAKLKTLDLPSEAMFGQVLAKDLLDKATGEIVLEANALIDEDNEVLEALKENNVSEITCLFINELDKGPYISNTLRADPTSNRLEALVEIYRMMRPGEPPTKDSARNFIYKLILLKKGMTCLPLEE